MGEKFSPILLINTELEYADMLIRFKMHGFCTKNDFVVQF